MQSAIHARVIRESRSNGSESRDFGEFHNADRRRNESPVDSAGGLLPRLIMIMRSDERITGMHEWSLLNKERRGVLEGVARAWERMLRNKRFLESKYHFFLEDHAGLFFSQPFGTYIVVSNIEMGAELKPDLVVVSDNHSYGFKYELIELESPHDRIFTSKGRQSAKLTHALQQLEDWQRWLEKYSQNAKVLFPSKSHSLWGDPQISYTVVIGRRNEMLRNNEVRIQKATKYHCSIRSFDYLTDRLRQNLFVNHNLFERGKHLTDEEVNRIVSPFFRAMSSSSWRQYCKNPNFDQAHSLGFSGPSLLKFRPDNAALLKRFLSFTRPATRRRLARQSD